jgi:short-subunit dehydrogenase
MAAMAQADVTDHDVLEAATAAIELILGRIDVWVNCAGNATYGRFLDTSAADFRRVTDVTYLGTVNGTRIALQRMVPRNQGRIINLCSAVAFHGMPLMTSYSGAKHAVRGFDQAVRAELAQERSQVRLTTVFPPAVNTPFFDSALSHMGFPSRPIPPVYQPEIVAEAIHLAAHTSRGEMPITSTTLLFSIAVRLAPGLVGLLIRRLGYTGQLDHSPGRQSRYAPTLAAPSDHALAVRGSFGAKARAVSIHVRLLRGVAWATGRRDAALSGGKGRKVFFFEKKKQKTFV